MYATIKASTTGVVTAGQIQLVDIEWSGTGTLGDTLVITDNTGRVLWQAQAASATYNLSKSFARPFPVNGINIQTLSSGVVLFTYV